MSSEDLMKRLKQEILENKTPEAKRYNKPYHRLRRFLNKKFVLKTIKYGKKTLINTALAVWKYLIMLSITIFGVYLSLSNHFQLLINWIKSYFK